MYTLSVEKIISTAHQLRDFHGPCARVHGHNLRIRLDVQSENIDHAGIAIDFTNLDKKLWEVVGPFDHQLINSIPPFDKLNPTAENLAQFFYNQLQNLLSKGISLKRVTVWETDEYMVSYEE